MKVALLTREYPPEVYGGAGVHVEYLGRELAKLIDLHVHAWGGERPPAGPGEPVVSGYEGGGVFESGSPHDAALQTMFVDLQMAAAVEGSELVHSHTWYAQFGGHLSKLLYAIPHVATVHSLEPM